MSIDCGDPTGSLWNIRFSSIIVKDVVQGPRPSIDLAMPDCSGTRPTLCQVFLGCHRGGRAGPNFLESMALVS